MDRVSAELEAKRKWLETAVAAAEKRLAPLDKELVTAHAAKEKAADAVEVERAKVVEVIARRDPARLEVMNLQDQLGDVLEALGVQPATQGTNEWEVNYLTDDR